MITVLIGRGQREVFIGTQQIGTTAITIDMSSNPKAPFSLVKLLVSC